MDVEQAFHVMSYTTKSHRFNATIVSAALPRFIVRDANGRFVTDTDRRDYAQAAASHHNGTVTDRLNWRPRARHTA